MNLYQPTITGSLSVSGSVNISGSITIEGGGTISGTASIATTALTASSADNFLVRNTLTAQTLVVQTITSSVDFVTGSTRFGSTGSNTHQFTGSVTINGASATTSLNVVGSGPNGILLDQDSASPSASSRLFFKMNTQTYAMVADSNGLNLLSGATVGSSTGNAKMTISSSGNIGIGTTTPSSKLDVTDANGIPLRIGDISAAPSSQTAGYIGMSTFAFSGNNGDLVLYPRTSATSKILLMGGNVGIGTTTPASQLHISSPGATNAELRIVGYGYGSTYNTTLRSTVGSIGVLQFGNNGDNYILAGNTGAGGYLIFRINCSAESITSGTEAMRISSNGAVYKYISAIDTNSEMHYNIVASGGNTTTTTTTNGATYKIHTFTSTGTFTVYGYGLVEILVVGGGGGGGWDVGGGGGAGGYVETSTFVNTGAYTITIGGGGSGTVGPGGGAANSGVQSTALGFVALGGGGGGNYSGGTGGNGANGGGGSGYSGGFLAGGTGTFRQGNDGGAGRADLYSSGATGGGGGGAAAVGAQSTNNIASYALGGAGVISFISGSSVTYCKGGAGGGDSWGGATDGAANTGNGGDGAGNPNSGKNGGSGIVIIRYKV
jgi:hypothetical protein